MTVPVLYMVGSGRSGSTILAAILGSAPEVLSVGELYYIWDRGFRDNILCGCGQRFLDCPFWSAVAKEADITLVEALDSLSLRDRVARTRNGLLRPDSRALADFQARLSRLYTAIMEVSDRKLIVDSSKVPMYGMVLADSNGVEVAGLHLIRDPRGVVYSWSRSKKSATKEGDFELPRKGTVQALGMWIPWNALAEFHWQREGRTLLQMRYEDWIAAPEKSLSDIETFVGIPFSPPVDDDGRFVLHPSHSVSGNPSRFSLGPTDLSPDDKWKAALPSTTRMLVTTITFPFLIRYGYPVRSGGEMG